MMGTWREGARADRLGVRAQASCLPEAFAGSGETLHFKSRLAVRLLHGKWTF